MSESLCMCGHECRAHPNVGRIASWPTRCLYCECLEFKPREEAAERERDDLGPLFIRDACRILDVDEHDISRMDALADRLAALAAAALCECGHAAYWHAYDGKGDCEGSNIAAPGSFVPCECERFALAAAAPGETTEPQ
jgi:hypothetical protein